MNGVTGDPATLTAARSLISSALTEKIRLIVLTRADLAVLRSVPEFVVLIKRKTLELVATGTTI